MNSLYAGYFCPPFGELDFGRVRSFRVNGYQACRQDFRRDFASGKSHKL